MPFLPGDSLLFVAGTLAAQPNPDTGQPLLQIAYLISAANSSRLHWR